MWTEAGRKNLTRRISESAFSVKPQGTSTSDILSEARHSLTPLTSPRMGLSSEDAGVAPSMGLGNTFLESAHVVHGKPLPSTPPPERMISISDVTHVRLMHGEDSSSENSSVEDPFTIQRFTSLLRQREAEILDLHARLLSSEGRLASKESEHAACVRSNDLIVAQMKAAIREKEEKILEIQRCLVDKESSFQSERENWQTREQDLLCDVQRAREESVAASRALSFYKNQTAPEIAELTEKLLVLEERKRELECDLMRSKQQILSLQEQLKTFSSSPPPPPQLPLQPILSHEQQAPTQLAPAPNNLFTLIKNLLLVNQNDHPPSPPLPLPPLINPLPNSDTAGIRHRRRSLEHQSVGSSFRFSRVHDLTVVESNQNKSAGKLHHVFGLRLRQNLRTMNILFFIISLAFKIPFTICVKIPFWVMQKYLTLVCAILFFGFGRQNIDFEQLRPISGCLSALERRGVIVSGKNLRFVKRAAFALEDFCLSSVHSFLQRK